MRIFSWNCRGAGKAPTVRAIKALSKESCPYVLFLAESKSILEYIRLKIGFEKCFVKRQRGVQELASFWKKGVDLKIVSLDKSSIVALVYSDPLHSVWMLIAVHGPPNYGKRARFWRSMEDIVKSFSGPWMMIGDLNCISSNEDKKGGQHVGDCSTRILRNFMFNTGAIDIQFLGPSFTWSNKRSGIANIRERLDRSICDQDWRCMFPKVGVRHLVAPCSDHNPILLDTHLENQNLKRPFRFEAMWIRDESSSQVVEGAWNIPVKGSQSFKLMKKQRMVCQELKKWNRNYFRYTRIRIKELESLISELQQKEPSPENLEKEAALMMELEEWLERDELKWR